MKNFEESNHRQPNRARRIIAGTIVGVLGALSFGACSNGSSASANKKPRHTQSGIETTAPKRTTTTTEVPTTTATAEAPTTTTPTTTEAPTTTAAPNQQSNYFTVNFCYSTEAQAAVHKYLQNSYLGDQPTQCYHSKYPPTGDKILNNDTTWSITKDNGEIVTIAKVETSRNGPGGDPNVLDYKKQKRNVELGGVFGDDSYMQFNASGGEGQGDCFLDVIPEDIKYSNPESQVVCYPGENDIYINIILGENDNAVNPESLKTMASAVMGYIK